MRSLLLLFAVLMAVRASYNETTTSVQEQTTTTSLRTVHHETINPPTTTTSNPASTGVPLASSSAASPNVPPPAVILPNATKDEKDAYAELQRSLLDQLDTSKSPCDSFYEYTCRNGTANMLAEANERINRQLKKRLDEPPPSGPTAKAFHYFLSCVEQFEKPAEQQAADWRRVLEELLREVPDWSFPFVPELPVGRPTARSFGAFLGVLYRDFGLRFPFDVELRRTEGGRLSLVLDAPDRTRTMGSSELGALQYALLVTRRLGGNLTDEQKRELEAGFDHISDRRVLEKVNAYAYHLSYDQQAFDDALLSRIADRLDVRPNDPFFSVYRAVARLEVGLLLDRANGTLNFTAGRLCFFGMATMVNAFYMPSEHSINIPFGIQLLPLFDEAYPIGAQFGILGVALGHEMGHAFGSSAHHPSFNPFV
ncbi:Membrane metallo-endopeptidase-like 1 [Aphelenchoides fujianensis]|nr:Membrane metallo-endopeptidase-like 1 [Aphelenchoides fujianensis]